ncbi:hypothetical protein K7W42_12800 [Deinococcus sp. HMF7604]|uniref:hypothetical protein n=1 Tax=Deinococcus betulae TaxID=2873312 RepID=UPI001CD0374F|nr:hypothetical protein [Deinococcus betulae]MBZ9751738.1 hypothetical protein [Deinococcus betulae]
MIRLSILEFVHLFPISQGASVSTLPPSLDASTVLNDLKYIVHFAEQGTGLRVISAVVDLTAVTSRTGGGGTPPIALLSKDGIGGDMTRADTQRISFALKRAATPSFSQLPGQLREAVEIVRTGLAALATLRDDFDATAKMEFKFELTSEGKFSFFVRLGAKAADTHSLTVEVEAASART